MSSNPSPTRWQRRADARPEELLNAGLALFVERGYAATRLEEVAQMAGVSKSTLYLYYENKLELFKAVVRHSMVSGLDEIAQHQISAKASAHDQLVSVLSAFMHRVASSPLSGIPKLVISEAGNFPEIARFYHDEVIQRGKGMVTAVLKQGIRTGEFREVDVDYAWRVVIAPLMLSIIWKHSFQPFESAALDYKRHLQTHLDLLFNGLQSGKTRKEKS